MNYFSVHITVFIIWFFKILYSDWLVISGPWSVFFRIWTGVLDVMSISNILIEHACLPYTLQFL